MSKEEWQALYKARFESQMGLTCEQEFLDSAYECDPDANPEAAAADEIALWGE